MASTADAQLEKVISLGLPMRVGHGFDLHRLEPGLPFVIGGKYSVVEHACDAIKGIRLAAAIRLSTLRASWWQWPGKGAARSVLS